MQSAILRFIGVTLPLALVINVALAQNPTHKVTRTAELQAFSSEFRARAQQSRLNAEARAREARIPLRKELPGGRLLELQRFEAGRGPVYYITNNAGAAATTSTDAIWPGGIAGLALDGFGMAVGEWDGGAVYGTHPDLIGRVTQVDGASSISNHATHVAGTLVGAGAYLLPEARGMAFAAALDAYDWNDDAAEMAAAAADGLLLSNHSYGIAAGWLYIGDPAPETWWWIGGSDPDDIEDPNFGYYDVEAQSWDQIAHAAPYYLIVKAAGNDGSDIGPAPGEEYTVIDQDGNPLFVSDLPRNADCTPAGYDCLPTHSVAKNVLTVGAVDDIPGGYSLLTGPDAVILGDFSSRGPTDDGRIKPDIVGNGVLLLSTWSEQPYYAAAAGTSMAAPNVTGSLLLLQQHYENLYGSEQYLLAASLKALVIHTADEAGANPGPDYHFGWGLMNAQKAAALISSAGSGPLIIESSLAGGAVNNHEFTATGSFDELVATLVWADPAGTPVAPALDPPDLMLVNDLDLRIEHAGEVFEPWVLNPATPAAAAFTGDNFRDNVEQVLVSGAGAGVFTVRVSHKGELLNGAAQNYSLIISERAGPPSGAEVAIEEDFTDGLPAGWSVSGAETGVSWAIRTPLLNDLRYDNLTGGSGNFAMVDNNFVHESYTGLISPVLDLTDNTAVVLRFKSYMLFDAAESINVEVSTDGGANWLSAWRFQGFNPLPTPYVLDLSAALAGEPHARFRFWYDSEGDLNGDLWQIDDVRLDIYGGASQTQSEMCSGTDVLVQNHTFTGSVNCSASSSWVVHNNVTVAAGAAVQIAAPAISLGPGVTVQSGGRLSVRLPTQAQE